MSTTTSDLQEAIEVVMNLSPLDKVRLVERVMVTLAEDITQSTKSPRKPLYGLWSEVSISSDEIDEARAEMWNNFPREDI